VKKFILAIVSVLLVAIVATGCQQTEEKTLNVNDLRSDPTAYTGALTVTGIMAAVSQHDPRIFGIMDKSELLCTMPNCNRFLLPIRFVGQRPAYGDEVVVTGTFIEGGRLFTATEVNVVRNHKL
jgi:hypothetical protein